MMKKALLLLSVLSVVGCNTASNDPNPLGDPALKDEVMKPLVCNSKDQCDVFWQRAQVWVVNNSGWRIQTATDAVISTFPPLSPYPWRTAYEITKLPNEGGTATIKIKPYCDPYVAHCNPKVYPMVVSFKRYVSTGKE